MFYFAVYCCMLANS